ncbi:hypothetical protein AB0L34_02505 [Micromonospora sp. NPDC052213]|uniref:hypothetical protein n=1 Tax=Micromonospora sp. NPDC052213 TaxID=3155812 RepID=UPI00341DF9C7
MTLSTAESVDSEQRILLRIGAVCAIAGPLVLGASFAPHGDLPTREESLVGEAVALRFIADHQTWLLIHLGTIVAGLIWLGAFVALANTLMPGAARAVGRFLIPSAIVGSLFVVFDYGVDGYALKILANEWATATGPEQEALQRMAETGIWFLNGTFHSEIVVFYGLTMLLAGLAVALDTRYPRWFAVAGAIAGALVLTNGLLAFAGIGLAPAGGTDLFLFVMVLPLESLWLMVLGRLMWRNAKRRAAQPPVE